MKKYFLGVITGFIVCTMLVSAVAVANSPIKLIVNGSEVKSDVPPQIISGRTMIPARPLAEALGADVRWDEENYAVIVTGGVQAGAVPVDLEPVRENANIVDNNKSAEENEGVSDMDTTQTGTTSHGVFIPDSYWRGAAASPMTVIGDGFSRKSIHYYDTGDDVLVTQTTLTYVFQNTDLHLRPSRGEDHTTVTARDGSIEKARIKQYIFNEGIYLYSINEIKGHEPLSLTWNPETKTLHVD